MKITQTVIFSFLLFSGCNFYGGIDKPSGDTQLLEAARACFDQGNYECATSYYSQLSSASSDTAISETVFKTIAEIGITAGDFMNAVFSGSTTAGKLITLLANEIGSNASVATRLSIFHAYQKYTQVNDLRAQGLIRFLTASALFAELLAEDIGSTGKLLTTDIVQDPETCAKTKITTLPIPGCSKPTGKKLISGSSATLNLTSATDSDLSGTASFQLINATIVELDTAIRILSSTGSIGSSVSSFTGAFIAVGGSLLIDTGDSTAFRRLLIQNGIGSY